MRGGLRPSSAKFPPAVVMSVGSVLDIPSQKPWPELRVNLCIQVYFVWSSLVERPYAGSAGKPVFPGYNISSPTIPIHQ